MLFFNVFYYLRQDGYVIDSVHLSVCKITHKIMDGFWGNQFSGNVKMVNGAGD